MANIIKNRQFDLYSKSAACQFKLQKIADPIDEGKTKEAYHVFVDASNAKPGEDKPPIHYDWNNKISLRLSLTDIGVFLNGIRLGFDVAKNGGKEFELFHDPGKGSATNGQKTKVMGIRKGQQYGYQIYFRQKEKVNGEDKSTNVAVPIRDSDMAVLRVLLERAVIMLAGFHGED
jgi:hypothetical protein